MPRAIKVIQNIEEAEEAWRCLCPLDTWYSEWPLRYTFYKNFNYPLYFFISYQNDQPVALLALQLNTEKKALEFFGGSYMEENQIYYQKGCEEQIALLYQEALKTNLALDLLGIKKQVDLENLQFEDYKYYLDLEKCPNLETYLQDRFDSKGRSDYLRKIKKIEEQKIIVQAGNTQDLEALFSFNIKRFGSESSFTWPHRQNIFKDLVSTPYDWFIDKFYHQTQLIGVSIGVLCHRIYVYLNAGVDLTALPGLGNYATFLHLQRAFQLKAKIFDCGLENYTWKERWHLDKMPLYKLVR